MDLYPDHYYSFLFGYVWDLSSRRRLRDKHFLVVKKFTCRKGLQGSPGSKRSRQVFKSKVESKNKNHKISSVVTELTLSLYANPYISHMISVFKDRSTSAGIVIITGRRDCFFRVSS